MVAKNTYRLGKRLVTYRNILIIVSTMVIFCFYLIYDFVMVPVLPWLAGAPLVAIFILIEAIMVAVVRWGADKIKEGTVYVLKENGLEIQMGRNKRFLAWKDFQKARYQDLNFQAKCPVTYTVKGEDFLPNQYLDDIWAMNQEILNRIRPYAEIEEGLERKVSAFV